MNNPRDFRVYHSKPKESQLRDKDEKKKPKWRKMNKGVSDIYRRAHGLIRKMPNSYRYVISKKGNEIIPAILGYRECTLRNIYKAAA